MAEKFVKGIGGTLSNNMARAFKRLLLQYPVRHSSDWETNREGNVSFFVFRQIYVDTMQS